MGWGNEVLRDVFVSGTSPSLRVTLDGGFQQLNTLQDLSVGELDYTTTLGKNFTLLGVYFKFDSPTTQEISLEYNGGVIFKEVVNTSSFANIVISDLKILAGLGNELTVKCTNNGTPAINVEVIIDIEVK
jgi:hypothetical protein